VFNYKKYTIILSVLNALFVLIGFFTFTYMPIDLGFAVFEHSLRSDPVETYFTLFLGGAVILSVMALALKLKRIAFYVSIMPLASFFSGVFVGFITMVLG
jgi:hypothetical protein